MRRSARVYNLYSMDSLEEIYVPTAENPTQYDIIGSAPYFTRAGNFVLPEGTNLVSTGGMIETGEEKWIFDGKTGTNGEKTHRLVMYATRASSRRYGDRIERRFFDRLALFRVTETKNSCSDYRSPKTVVLYNGDEEKASIVWVDTDFDDKITAFVMDINGEKKGDCADLFWENACLCHLDRTCRDDRPITAYAMVVEEIK